MVLGYTDEEGQPGLGSVNPSTVFQPGPQKSSPNKHTVAYKNLWFLCI
jgi:hypothetical protein